ncbi:MAG: L-threonylcarbamoyladenylate synthase [bacterium]
MITTIGNVVSEAAAILKGGDVCAIPTETVYGLAVNALDPTAVAKIFEAKNRPFFDPLIVHLPDIQRVRKYVSDFPAWALKLSEAFMPGALTLVLPKKSIIPDIVTSGLNTVAVRIPNHPLTLELLHQLDFPLAAPSANPFGYVSPTSAQHVFAQLGGKIPYILDGGRCNIGIESTIIGEIDGKPTILRLGGITVEEIREVIPDFIIASSTEPTTNYPGGLAHHYSPKNKLVFGNMNFVGQDLSKVGVISFRDKYPLVSEANQIVLSASGDLREAAQNIFSAMRLLDRSEIKVVFAERFPNEGLGRAINDRLRRASSR